MQSNKHNLKMRFYGLPVLFFILATIFLACLNTGIISHRSKEIVQKKSLSPTTENKNLITADEPGYKIEIITINKKDICPDTCSNIIYDLSFPKFTGVKLPDILNKANSGLPEVVENIVSTIQSFIEPDEKATSPDTGHVKIYYYNYYSGSSFLSFQFEPSSSYYIRPGSIPLYCFNYNLIQGLSLTADSCFKLKTTPEAWISFVNNRPCPDCNWHITNRAFLPLFFLASEEGVQFFFDYNDTSNITFSWSEIARFFEIKNIPEELYR